MQVSSELLRRRKLNLGCGHDLRDGYINVDLHARHNPDLVADITKLDMLPSQGFDEIVAQDVLEHLERQKVQGAVVEWANLLAVGGVLRVRVPSLEHMLKALCRPENRSAKKADEIIHLIFGTQAYTGDYHLSGFTAAVLEARLENAGLKVCNAMLMYDMVYDVTARKCEQLTDPLEFVHNSYFAVLGRPADPDGLEYFSAKLSSNELSRDQVLEILKNSDEYKFLQHYPSYMLWMTC